MDFPIKEIPYRDIPPLLTEITDPPKKLYIRGVLPSLDWKWLCVVGSRKFSPYGRDACRSLIEALHGYPIVIVSGLALGMDGIAHESALSAGLPTVAVPGSGLSDRVLYPRSHFGLAKRILAAGGALLSEFEPEWNPRPESFPQRNRIMAGLSHATFIVEATMKSGTLITSRLASEYNRDVFALTHPIGSATGEGPHMLQKLGAIPIRSSEDILEALGLNREEKISTNTLLSDAEKNVIAILSSPCSRDELVERLGMPAREVNILLGSMELKGLIDELGGLIRRI